MMHKTTLVPTADFLNQVTYRGSNSVLMSNTNHLLLNLCLISLMLIATFISLINRHQDIKESNFTAQSHTTQPLSSIKFNGAYYCLSKILVWSTPQLCIHITMVTSISLYQIHILAWLLDSTTPGGKVPDSEASWCRRFFYRPEVPHMSCLFPLSRAMCNTWKQEMCLLGIGISLAVMSDESSNFPNMCYIFSNTQVCNFANIMYFPPS